MYIHKYLAANRPNYISDGGYYIDKDEYVLGFSEKNNDATIISTENAAKHICSLSLSNLTTEVKNTLAEKYTKAISFLNDYSINTLNLVENDIISESRELIINRFREVRTYLIYASDYTVNNSNLSETEQTQWSSYRQSLFDMPENLSSIDYYEQITYPEPPSNIYDKIKILYPHYKNNKDSLDLIGD